MSLSDLIAGVEAHEKTLTVYNADAGDVESIRERFADRNVSVEAGDADGPSSFAVLHDGEEYLDAVDVAALVGTDDESVGLSEAPYRAVLDHLDETIFTSYSTSRMLAASREVEDRAWRMRRGRLHAGFQTTDRFETQADTYEQLAAKGDLSVHVYAAPEGEDDDGSDTPAVPDVTFHLEDTDEIRNSWFVVYDGAGIDTNKCALLAEEREPRRFYGFWTYDTTTVDYILEHLEDRYNVAAADGGI